MAIRMSDALTALITGDVGLRNAISGAQIVFYTGSQPTSANDTPGSSQAILAFTESDGVYVAEVPAQYTFVFSGITGTAGLSAITLDGGMDILGATVTHTTLAGVADAVALQINTNLLGMGFSAVSDSVDTVTVYAPKGSGTSMDAVALVGTESGTITCTEGGAAGIPNVLGTAAANALDFSLESDGSGLSPAEEVFYVGKPAGATWKGMNGFGPATAAATAVFTGITDAQTYTAGWGRICCSSGDDGSTATSGASGYIRMDFSVGTSGTDIIMSPAASFLVDTTVADGIFSTLSTFKLKVNKKMA